MNNNIQIIKGFRKLLLTKTENLSMEELNHIPEGFTNNIIWQLGHLNAVLQALCYRGSVLHTTIDNNYILPFLPGTKPTEIIPASETEIIKTQLISTIDQLENDYNNSIFKTYTKNEKIKTIYGMDVESIDSAIAYATHHEGIHYYAILQLIKIITLDKK